MRMLRTLVSPRGFDGIAVGGGGVRTIAYAGALGQLGDARLHTIKHVTGTSGGCAAAIMLAARMPAHALADSWRHISFERLAQAKEYAHAHLLVDAMHIVKSYGVLDPQLLDAVYEQAMGAAGISIDTTFAEMRQLYNTNLQFVATDLNRGRPFVFSADTTPDEHIVFGARASSAIPGFFFPVTAPDGTLLVDGGVSGDTHVGACKAGGATRVLRLSLRSTDDDTPRKVNSLVDYLEAIEMAQLRSIWDAPPLPAASVTIWTNDVRATDFEISEQQKELLVEQGVKAARRAFPS